MKLDRLLSFNSVQQMSNLMIQGIVNGKTIRGGCMGPKNNNIYPAVLNEITTTQEQRWVSSECAKRCCFKTFY